MNLRIKEYIKNTLSLIEDIIRYNKCYYLKKGLNSKLIDFLLPSNFNKKGTKYYGIQDFIGKHKDFEKIVLMDIGARGDLPKKWSGYRNYFRIIGFEPAKDECEVLEKNKKIDDQYFAEYIGDNKEKEFFIASFPHSSGLKKTDTQFIERHYQTIQKNLKIIETKSIKTVSIDHLISNRAIEKPDFLKIDVEGFELEVLQHASSIFDKCLGVFIEINLAPLKKNYRFNEIHSVLENSGFYVHEIFYEHSRAPKNSFSKKYQFIKNVAVNHTQDFGQRMVADFLYLKDPIKQMQGSLSSFMWNDTNVLKMVLIYNIYELFDCSIEILEFYNKNFSSALPFDLLKKLCIPPKCNPRFYEFNLYKIVSEYLDPQETLFKPHRRT